MNVTLTCGTCGHKGEFDDFCKTPVGGDLPRGVYQCPVCNRAVRVTAGPGTRFPSGLYVPGPITLVPVDARL
jgi:hypothetical protein